MSCTKFTYVLRGSLTKIPVLGVIFDLDGTLTIPVLDFSLLRKRLNLTAGEDILQSLEHMNNRDQKAEALKIIEQFEEEGREKFQLQPGVNEMLQFFHDHRLHMAVVTRNDDKAIEQFLAHLKPSFQDGKIFTHLLTRDFKPAKPDPAAVFYICKEWNVKCSNVLFVGDHYHDMECGHQAGTGEIIILNTNNGYKIRFTIFHHIQTCDLIGLCIIIPYKHVAIPMLLWYDNAFDKH